MASSKAGYRAGRDVAAQAENIELLTGQRGDRLDKAITYRDLADIGLITLRKAVNKTYYGEAAPGVLPDDTIDRPSAPTGVIANGAFHTILVEWDKPAYDGHAYAEVWRAEEDNRAMAVMVGASAANLYSDAIGGGAAVYYWVRFVNRNNIVGPFNAVSGTYAETSRDVQDILDELEGKIAASHLVAELLEPIQSIPAIKIEIPQIKVDLTALNNALDQTAADLAALDARETQVSDLLHIDLSALSDALDQAAADLAALDARETQVSDLLQTAQDDLGNNYLSVVTIQEQLRQKIDRYQGDFESFRTAVFTVNPSTGEITMDAVNAVRSELGADITAVSQHLDAVEAIVNTCVTRAELADDLERITSVEQAIDGINASLTQTATKSEVTAVSDTVSQVSQTLDATNVTLSQKAGQTQVDAQGQRLSAAEQQISANTTATEANAQLISQVKAQLEEADSTIASSITNLEQAIATQDAATAQRLTALETTTSSQSAQLTELQQVISGDGQSLANKFENIQASLVLAGESSLESTLASAEADRQAREASGQIRQEQSVMATEQSAQAKTILELTATFQSYSAELTAQISTVQTTLSNADQALAQRVDQVEAAYQAADSTTNATLASLQQTVADGDSALAQQISSMDVAYKAADATNAAAIASEQTARVNADQALSTSISQLDAAYKQADTTNSAAISELQQTITGNNQSLASKFEVIKASIDITGEASLNATLASAEADRVARHVSGQIRQDQRVMVSEQEAQAKAILELSATFESANSELEAHITSVQTALTSADQALASKVDQFKADYQAADTAINASIAGLQQVVSNGDSALAQQISSMEAAYKQADTTNSAAIQSEATARASADGALSTRIDTAQAKADSAAAAVQSEATARANADSALAQQITTVQASAASANSAASTAQSAADQAKADAATAAGIANSKGKVLIQSTAPAVADRLAQNLWIDTTGGANTPKRWNGTAWSAVTDKAATDAASAAAAAQATADAAATKAAQNTAAIQSEATARASADGALSSRIDTVQATANNTSAAVQTQSQAIANLQNGAQAMWTAKANAGQISAGIGLIAKSDGTSQVAISASQVFVFNPNSPNTLSPLFAIDNGQVIMAKAIIEKATIQILNAQTITADYVKAGVSLSAPVINGGQITIGSNFSVTSAGAMTAWSATLHYVTSLYGTFRYATIDQATITNCTITEDCDVKGTIYAERIVGDVVGLKSLSTSIVSGSSFTITFTVVAATFARDVVISGIQVNVEGYTQHGSGDNNDTDYTRSVTTKFTYGSTQIGAFTASATGAYRKDSCSPCTSHRLPANTQGVYSITFTGSVSSDYINVSGAVAMVTKAASATFA